MPRTKGSKNRPKTNTTKDYASQIAEKQESIVSLTAEIASTTTSPLSTRSIRLPMPPARISSSAACCRYLPRLRKNSPQATKLEAKKAKADAKAAEEAKKAEAEAVVKKLLAGGMSADEILEKLK